MKTAYIVQSFTKQGSQLITDTPIQCSNADEAIRRADKFADIRAGVIAISQEYDEETGDFGELKILAKYGEIPAGAIGDED